MALSRYVLTATVPVPAGTPATVTAGEPEPVALRATAAPASARASATSPRRSSGVRWSSWTLLVPSTPRSGRGNLRAFVQGQDDVGHAGLSN